MNYDDDLSRKQFEGFIGMPPFEKDIRRFASDGSSAWPGSYRDINVDLAWQAWQEARRPSAEDRK